MYNLKNNKNIRWSGICTISYAHLIFVFAWFSYILLKSIEWSCIGISDTKSDTKNQSKKITTKSRTLFWSAYPSVDNRRKESYRVLKKKNRARIIFLNNKLTWNCYTVFHAMQSSGKFRLRLFFATLCKSCFLLFIIQKYYVLNINIISLVFIIAFIQRQ